MIDLEFGIKSELILKQTQKTENKKQKQILKDVVALAYTVSSEQDII